MISITCPFAPCRRTVRVLPESPDSPAEYGLIERHDVTGTNEACPASLMRWHGPAGLDTHAMVLLAGFAVGPRWVMHPPAAANGASNPDDTGDDQRLGGNDRGSDHDMFPGRPSDAPEPKHYRQLPPDQVGAPMGGRFNVYGEAFEAAKAAARAAQGQIEEAMRALQAAIGEADQAFLQAASIGDASAQLAAQEAAGAIARGKESISEAFAMFQHAHELLGQVGQGI